MKLAAWAGFAIPELDAVLEGITAYPLPQRSLDAVYYDTPDLRLTRRGASLRYRSGDGTGWTVKLPERDEGDASTTMIRSELSIEGPADCVPAEAASLVRGHTRLAALEPVAHLKTYRVGVELRDGDDLVVAEVVDDEVSAYHGEHLALRFREIEVELYAGAPFGLLEAIIDRLRAAGAGDPDPTPKVARVLGARALVPPESAPVELDDDATTAEALRTAMSAAVTRILAHDPGVRIGDDPEDVHQARVGTRRLRSDLRTFGDVVEPEWAGALRNEVKELGDLLGAVRDADVLIDRFKDQADHLDPEPDAAGVTWVLGRLATQREEARARLLEYMDGRRYVELLDRLVAAANDPAALPKAKQPAVEVLPPLVRVRWRRLSKAVSKLPSQPADSELHRVRILAKRCRYASEAAAPVVGKPARTLAKAVAKVQTVLGDHQDAVVAEAWLHDRRNEAETATQTTVVDQLIHVQQTQAADCRARWPDAWKSASKRKLRSWLR